jgi:hypothetical protein
MWAALHLVVTLLWGNLAVWASGILNEQPTTGYTVLGICFATLVCQATIIVTDTIERNRYD